MRPNRPGTFVILAVASVAAFPAAASDRASEIAAAFVELGMAEPRAACYGETLAGELSDGDAAEAARIVTEAETSDDVKSEVLISGADLVGAFSKADVKCPEGMGG